MKTLALLSGSVLMLIAVVAYPQNVAITDDANYSADNSAMLDVKSTSKGLLIPRLTLSERNSIANPAKGLMVFVATDSTFYYFDGASWVNMLSSNVPDNDWTVSGSNMYSGVSGNVGIGTANPGQKLDVNGNVQANGFTMPTGASSGLVLTSDGSGNGSWQPAPSTSFSQVFTVAQSGGDFATISAALSACVNPNPNNRFLIRVMPGIYPENVGCKQYVRLQGSGKYTCHINGTVTAADSCTIEGFYIDGGVICQNTSPTIMENIITNKMGDGIHVTPPANPWIVQNEIVDCEGWGIHCNGWDAYAWIHGNKILRNDMGGIRCTESSPNISNNRILENHNYGIFLIGSLGFPAEPTIDDNQIGHTDPDSNGTGIFMTNYSEPRIIANDIFVNFTGIEIQPETQPSIMANNINYNHSHGIICYSSGASRPVTIKGNHINSNYVAGVETFNCTPIITHNNINYNVTGQDIIYTGPPVPMISFNVFDNRLMIGGTPATGLYNVTSVGAAIAP